MSSTDALTEPSVNPSTNEASAGPPRVHPDWADRAETLPAWARFKLGVVSSFLAFVAKVLGLDGLYRFGCFFGNCESLVSWSRWKRVAVRVDDIFPEGLSADRRRQIIRRYFRRTRCDKMFYTILDRLPREEILRRVHFEARGVLDGALSRGKGTYVAMAHYGALHVAGVVMALFGYRLAGVRDKNEGALRRYMQHKLAERLPEFAAFRMFIADAFPREIMRCFRNQFVVCSAMDVDVDRVQNARLRTCPVRLFGEERHFLTGPVQMALRCGAPVLQGFVISRENFHYEFVVTGPLIDPASDADAVELVARAMQNYADGIESHVRRFPCHIMKI